MNTSNDQWRFPKGMNMEHISRSDLRLRRVIRKSFRVQLPIIFIIFSSWYALNLVAKDLDQNISVYFFGFFFYICLGWLALPWIAEKKTERILNNQPSRICIGEFFLPFSISWFLLLDHLNGSYVYRLPFLILAIISIYLVVSGAKKLTPASRMNG